MRLAELDDSAAGVAEIAATTVPSICKAASPVRWGSGPNDD